MKYLYFDLIGGISGDMTVGALLDLGVDFEHLKRELKKIKVRGYSLKKSRVQRGHVKATKFDVTIQTPKNYSYRQIVRLIKTSLLARAIQDRILDIYRLLQESETKVHGHVHPDIKFEQLGDIDSLVDIAASCIALAAIRASGIYYSVIPLSQKIAQATWDLLKNKKVYFRDDLYENVTPTGMAILCGLGQQITPACEALFSIGRYGHGAGSLNPAHRSNVLRIIEFNEAQGSFETDEIKIIEANIDDMNPQFFGYIFDKLFQAGALDVFIENVTMKKTRPGFLLKVLSNQENLGKITRLLLDETTTLGVRFTSAARLKLSRRIKTFTFRGRPMRVKLARLSGGDIRIVPEYEDCLRLARETGTPISKIYYEVKKKAQSKWHSQD